MSIEAPKRVLVTGATGAVGPKIINFLLESGVFVRAFSSRPPNPGLLPSTVECLAGDIRDAAAVSHSMRDIDAVVHLAARLHNPNPAPQLLREYESVNVEGTSVVAEAARRHRVRRLVFFSSIGVYGNSNGAILDESSPTNPQTFYEQTKLAAEKIVLNTCSPAGTPTGVVLRVAAVYGGRVKGNYLILLRALARRRFVPIGAGRNRRTLIYDQDLARCTALALEHPAAAGKIFNVSDGAFHPMRDVLAAICSALQVATPRVRLPLHPTRCLVGLFEDAVRAAGRTPPINRAAIDKYAEDLAVDSLKIQRELGFRPQYDLKSGWKEAVDELRRLGRL